MKILSKTEVSSGWIQTSRGSACAAMISGMLLAGTVPAMAQGAVVEMTGNLRFQPETITISAGDTVEWRNTSGAVHTVTADPQKAADPSNVHLPRGAQTFDSGIVQPGGTFQHTFTVPGRYQYVCLPHEAAGMIGEVIVE
jgi:plastocyanin